MVGDADLLRGLDLRPPLGGGGGGGNTGTTEGGAPIQPTGASHGTTAAVDTFIVGRSLGVGRYIRGIFVPATPAAVPAVTPPVTTGPFGYTGTTINVLAGIPSAPPVPAAPVPPVPAAPVASTATRGFRGLAVRAGASLRGAGMAMRGLGFFGCFLRALPVIGALFALCDLASSAEQEEAVSTQRVFDNFLEGRSDAEKQRAFEIYRTQGAAGLSTYLKENLGFSEESVDEFTNGLKDLKKLQEQAATDRTRNMWLTIGGLVLGGLFALCTGGVGAIFLGACTGMCYGNLLNMGCRYIPGLAPDFGSLLRGRPNNNAYRPSTTSTASA